MSDMSYNYEPMNNTIKLSKTDIKIIDVSKRKFFAWQLDKNNTNS